MAFLFNLIQKLPGGHNTKVFIGTSTLLGLCAIPVFYKPAKRGHDLFSQEKPEAVLNSQEKLLKEFDRKSRQERHQ